MENTSKSGIVYHFKERLGLCFGLVYEVSGSWALPFLTVVFSIHHLARTTPFFWSCQVMSHLRTGTVMVKL